MGKKDNRTINIKLIAREKVPNKGHFLYLGSYIRKKGGIEYDTRNIITLKWLKLRSASGVL